MHVTIAAAPNSPNAVAAARGNLHMAVMEDLDAPTPHKTT